MPVRLQQSSRLEVSANGYNVTFGCARVGEIELGRDRLNWHKPIVSEARTWRVWS